MPVQEPLFYLKVLESALKNDKRFAFCSKMSNFAGQNCLR